MGRWGERAKQLKQEANPPSAKGIAALGPGVMVHYQIPAFERDRQIGWVKQVGRVRLIDDHGQAVVVTPLDEQEPWRWVAMTYVNTF